MIVLKIVSWGAYAAALVVGFQALNSHPTMASAWPDLLVAAGIIAMGALFTALDRIVELLNRLTNKHGVDVATARAPREGSIWQKIAEN